MSVFPGDVVFSWAEAGLTEYLEGLCNPCFVQTRTGAARCIEDEAEVAALSELTKRPAGNIRISAAEHAVNTVIWPRLAGFLQHYPGIIVEIIVNYGLSEIVAEHYDASVRLGGQSAKDRIAVRFA